MTAYYRGNGTQAGTKAGTTSSIAAQYNSFDVGRYMYDNVLCQNSLGKYQYDASVVRGVPGSFAALP
eukprot:2527615-Rhodomonas_salina.3